MPEKMYRWKKYCLNFPGRKGSSAGRDTMSGCMPDSPPQHSKKKSGTQSEVIVIDGCTDCCAKKKLSSSRLAPDCHIIATDLGIVKNGMGEVTVR